MCGIAGSYGANGGDAAGMVRAMTEAQRHRGPDHEEVSELSSPVSSAIFGHNRLSIIDLSDAANQPMWDALGRICIVYNGEIYNHIELRDELTGLGHRFATQSDTEVILEAFKRWQADAFSRLNGMFAFALFDRSDGRLWLVRDRFGVKPLFYAMADHTLVFASTPGPIARALGCEPNLEYVARGLRYWLYEDDGDISQYAGVAAVPAGHYLVSQAQPSGQPSVGVRRWYDYATRVEELHETLAAAPQTLLLDEFSAVLESAVALRLRSDVPVGISLSGGLDSSTIAAIVSSGDARISGFSFGHPADAASEGPLVADMAARAGLDVTYARSDQAESVAAFWEALEAQDAPFPDLSIVAQYLVFRAAHAAGLKVLLGGQGSDEVLMGYRKFQLMLLRDAARHRHPRELLRTAIGAGLMLLAESGRASTYVRQRNRYLKRGGLSSALRLPDPAPLSLNVRTDHRAWQRQILDVTRLSLPTLLRYEDRNSMGNSLETRLPFLDFRLAELAVALPDAMKARGGYGKWILREAMRDRVPDAIRRARYKRGFDVPRASWIGGGLGGAVRLRLREQEQVIKQWIPAGADIDHLFADSGLVTSPTAFTEATSLLWLAKRS